MEGAKYIELGTFRLYPLLDGYFRLDGGGMFGIIPRVMWSRHCTPDDRNRVRLAVRSLLFEANGKWVLIDTGMGDKFDAKMDDIYAIEKFPRIEQQLDELGLKKSDIDIVINTHLHWDHAGGNTIKDPSDGTWVPNFVNARFVSQKGEYESATVQLNERTRASYRGDDYLAIHQNGLFDLIEGDREILPGVRVFRSGGHVPHHQSVYLESSKSKAFYIGDIVPTHIHLPISYIMGFDLEPLRTLEKKKEYFEKAILEDWLVFFPHDPDVVSGKIDRHEKQGYQLRKS